MLTPCIRVGVTSHFRIRHAASISSEAEHTFVEILVGGIPTPLKNDGLRQLGWFSIPNWMESHSKFHGSKPQPVGCI